FEAVTRAILRGDDGDMRTQLGRPEALQPPTAPLVPVSSPSRPSREAGVVPLTMFSNGLGGFTDGGRTYAMTLDGATETPMPWTNIIANAQFGTVITASGSAHTWAGNSRENRLT